MADGNVEREKKNMLVRRGGATVLTGVLTVLLAMTAGASDLRVDIQAPEGNSISSGTLIIDERSIPITKNEPIIVKDVPERRIAVTVDAMVGGKDGVRHIGVAELPSLSDRTGNGVTVKVVPFTTIDDYCLGCHPVRGKKGKPDILYRDLHSSGKELPAPYVAQVKKYNEKLAKLAATKTPTKLLPIPLEERIVKIAGKDVKKLFFTCESCHTTHLTTIWSKSMRAAFIGGSDLCEGCHF